MRTEAETGNPVVFNKSQAVQNSSIMKAKEQASVLFVMCMKVDCIPPLTKVSYN